MHGHSLLCMVYVLYIIDRARQLKLFHFVAPAFAHAFTFQKCEPRQGWCLPEFIREIGSECKEISGAL